MVLLMKYLLVKNKEKVKVTIKANLNNNTLLLKVGAYSLSNDRN